MAKPADLETCLDHGRMGPFQVLVIVLCSLMVMIDGFDTQVIGMAAPAIAAAWHVPAPAFGPVFGLGLLGSTAGAILFGDAGDRFGRKPVLIAAILLFAGVSLLTPFTSTIPELIAVRLISGIGLGGALPGLIAITSDYAPKAIRARVTAVMYCSFPLGSVLAGFIAAAAIPVLGWGSVFYVGSLFPLVLLPVFAAVVPESARVLALRGQTGRVEKILSQVRSELAWNGKVLTGEGAPRASLMGLFAEGRAIGTALLWTTLFLSLLVSVFMVSWVPLVARGAGIDVKSAVLAVSAWNIGGIAGAFLIGWMSGRLGLIRTIALAYAIGGAGVAVLGFAQSGAMLLAIAFGAGVFVVGAQMSMIGLTASFYETSLRASGVGWALGIGKIGSVVGPILGGLLIGAGMGMPALFAIAGLMALVTALSVFSLGLASKRPAAAVALPEGQPDQAL